MAWDLQGVTAKSWWWWWLLVLVVVVMAAAFCCCCCFFSVFSSFLRVVIDCWSVLRLLSCNSGGFLTATVLCSQSIFPRTSERDTIKEEGEKRDEQQNIRYVTRRLRTSHNILPTTRSSGTKPLDWLNKIKKCGFCCFSVSSFRHSVGIYIFCGVHGTYFTQVFKILAALAASSASTLVLPILVVLTGPGPSPYIFQRPHLTLAGDTDWLGDTPVQQ